MLVPGRREGDGMAWRIKAKYYEACNCAYGCPCNMSGFPTHGNCEGVVTFVVTEGERDGVDLSGAKAAALGPILMAEDPGLPWEILATTISEIHGPFMESISIDDKGPDSRITVA